MRERKIPVGCTLIVFAETIGFVTSADIRVVKTSLPKYTHKQRLSRMCVDVRASGSTHMGGARDHACCMLG